MGKTLTLDVICSIMKLVDKNCSCINEQVRRSKYFGFVCPSYTTKIPTPVSKYEYTKESFIYGVIVSFASTLGMFGNGIILLVALKNQGRLLNHNVQLTCQTLITKLAASDFLFAFLQILVSIPTLWTDKWLYGSFMCKILRSGETLSAVIAIGFIVIISTERFLGVVKPMYKSQKLIFILCCVNIAVGLITIVPLLVHEQVNRHKYCQIKWPSPKANVGFNIYLLVFMTILPATIGMLLYFSIAIKLRDGLKGLQEGMDEKLLKKRTQESWRVIKIVLVLVLAFVGLVFPKRIIFLYLSLEDEVPRTTYSVLTVISLVTYPFHVAVNPLLYSFIDTRWRKEVKVIFKRKVNYTPATSPSNQCHRKQFRKDTKSLEFLDNTEVLL